MESNIPQLKPSPRLSAGCLSKLFFMWIYPLFWKGRKKELEYEDIFEALPGDHAKELGDKLALVWNAELEKSRLKNRRPSLRKALTKIFFKGFIYTGCLIFVEECISKPAQPIMLGLLLRYFSTGVDYTHTRGYLYASGVVLFVVYFITSHHPTFFELLHMNLRIRVACSNLVYRKALRLSQAALGQSTVGQIVNLLSNDVARFDYCMNYLHYIWTAFIQFGIVVFVLWNHFQIACLAGVGFLAVIIPFESCLGHFFGKIRLSVAGKTDLRIRIMNEIVNGIRVIKMYAWEIPFSKMVADARKDEIRTIGKAFSLRAINLSFYFVSSKMIVFLTLVTYILTSENAIITSEKVFLTMALYQNIRVSMTVNFPQGIAQLAETLVSIKRVEDFLILEEYEPHPITLNKDQTSEVKSEVVLQNVTVKWDSQSTEPTLKNVTLKVTENEILAVVGSVGSGKSSLLQVILRELPVSTGELNVKGSIAYVPQEAWVFSGTVRENILFGRDYQPDWYRAVVDACALREDFESFASGDKSRVGDKGISLSGGQKARLNLARAVYINADIYLLDDPLSAVDAKTSRHLFEKCICGILKSKAVILVTHQVQYLHEVKEILVLNDGKVMSQGTYSELQSRNIDLHEVLARVESISFSDRRSLTLSSSSGPITFMETEHRNSMNSPGIENEAEEKTIYSYENVKEVIEIKSTGKIGSGVYWKYFHAGTTLAFLGFLLIVNIITQFVYTGSDYWLQLWITAEKNNYTGKSDSDKNLSAFLNYLFPTLGKRDQFISAYSAIILILTIMSTIRTFGFMRLCKNSSVALHHRLFYGILRAPMIFFDQNPVGRILNRFTKDIGTIDEQLPFTLFDTVELSLQVLGVVVIVGIINPVFLIPAAFIAVFFYILRNFFQCTARNLKQLEGTARSPVYSHLSTSLGGLTTVRAFNAQERFEREFEAHLDLHSATVYLFIASARWLGIVVDWFSILYTSCVTFGVVALNIDAAAAGLAISSAISLTRQMQWGVRQSVEAENQLVAVERVLEYSDLEPEAALESSKDKKPPDTWPTKGEIEIKNLFLAYDNGVPFLKNITCVIHSLEKVGIVGRSGAGKTSLTSALFRLTEPSQGTILIDGINVLEIGLSDLRSKISIIPQDPVLFLGTFRFNFDPLGEFSDAEIWTALKDVHLFDTVKELSIGLDATVHEGGSNLSVGQRQLVCMGRATLRRNKILVMDEATANVDPETDALIQNTIRTNFKDCTVLTVAHRLQTVIDSDRIMVLDAGTIMEFDEPYTLLHDPTGGLYSLVQETGKESAEELLKLAKLHSESKKVKEGAGKITEISHMDPH